MSNKNKRRQIRATLPLGFLKMFDNICENEGKKESELAREAIVKYLQTYSSNKVIQEEKEMQTA
ncbi:hypothetical protein FW778_06220 [Ginsengibacter hankyongi]|uniref:Uncharacterized protein n=1 Tax=Ginsengibacter hankyongi TaxID=2607284 RepID=A0A5J5IMS6_9BACT|nr:hypothetical protein [Ginsengibacter hankyongi]KAA9041613.1 hypothetical protein FW778_06220 [Ginsengibacter hankyongi]